MNRFSQCSAGPELIEAFFDRFLDDYAKEAKEFGCYALDRTTVPKDKWFQPDEGILPAPLPQEQILEIKNMPNERKELLQQRIRDSDK